ncbi:HAD-superfamily phosphatase, subfamily IIIC/FkbH-like domain-containing protein [Succiniclasticum ruminis]|uniref:HAD-superfamily phosphatase, subfamily IIIC/FkbH-like domain-containing protein n=2 Tax=Succiniclasticum ruminis TaxID=40841 RepID=A0A1G6HRJ8_9FIRM|nr:HAD-superfamily phosphatase, subfamily IIIC/FkbH-like domain-containing protein [Succiniclasticum ruminis]
MRIALLSNVTTDLLASMLKEINDIYLAPGFDTWQQEILSSASGLYTFKPEAVVLLLYADAYSDTWGDREKGCSVIEEWIGMVRILADSLPGVPVFVSSIDVSNVTCHFGAEVRLEVYFESYFNERLQQLHAAGCNVYVLPVKDAVMELGRKYFYSSKMWYVGSMPYSMKGLAAIAGLIARYTSVIKGAKKKCVAVDLDNTLWGGVIGEDGVSGIQLSNNKEGARFKDTQRVLKKMKEQGVMLAILSKNNPEDVEPVFSHPDMVLQHEDFVAEVINWEPKTVNIRQLAADLNIGLDAFVFLDDNPVEREQMKAECPEVEVIEFPKDTSQLPSVVAKAYEEYFLTLEVTSEDTKKTAMYRSETKRKAEMHNAVSMEDFLKRLKMTMTIHFMKPEEEKRVVQLINKTNQFNVTTKRYSQEEVHALVMGKDSDILTVHMADKYGDQGLVAVLIIKYARMVAEIDTFLMSCRVMGRKVEFEMMAQVKNLLQAKGIQTVKATYIRTEKNAPVENLYDKLGFTVLDGMCTAFGDRKEYRANVADLPAETGVFRKVNSAPGLERA